MWPIGSETAAGEFSRELRATCGTGWVCNSATPAASKPNQDSTSPYQGRYFKNDLHDQQHRRRDDEQNVPLYLHPRHGLTHPCVTSTSLLSFGAVLLKQDQAPALSLKPRNPTRERYWPGPTAQRWLDSCETLLFCVIARKYLTLCILLPCDRPKLPPRFYKSNSAFDAAVNSPGSDPWAGLSRATACNGFQQLRSPYSFFDPSARSLATLLRRFRSSGKFDNSRTCHTYCSSHCREAPNTRADAITLPRVQPGGQSLCGDWRRKRSGLDVGRSPRGGWRSGFVVRFFHLHPKLLILLNSVLS
jgi:hypothetical protein